MDEALDWSDCLTHVEASDIGMRRSNNQDSYAVLLASDPDSWRRRGHVFVVADGMGAHAAGELASKMAADGIPHSYYKLREESPPDAIRKSIREANEQINRRGQANPEFKGMGTTTDVLVILPQGALIAHVGDSRVYRLRGTRLEQLTFDHSLVWEMTASGQFADGAAVNMVPKNIITRSLGPHPHVQVDLEGPYPIELGDTFLLCTDGLSGLVKDEEIGAILGVLPPAEAAQVLIDLANLRGGPDNITVIIARASGPAITWQGMGPVEPLALADERAQRAATQQGPSKKFWAVAAVAVAATIGLMIFSIWVAWLPAAMVAGALITWGILQRFAPPPEPRYLAPGARLGRGPYAACDCPPNEAMVTNLGLLIDQLREAASDGRWSVNWAKFDAFTQQGKLAADRRDYAQAVREFARAQRFMMNELRSQGRVRKGADAGEDVLN